MARDVLNVGVIGYGYWGPNIVRNFHGQEHSVMAVCDKSAEVSPSRAPNVFRHPPRPVIARKC